MLIPCAACRRHIEAVETVCPFCEAPNSVQPIPRPLLPGRWSRAAVFVGAAAIAAPACVSNPPPPPRYQQQPPPDPGDPNGGGYAQPPPGDPPPDPTNQPPPPAAPAIVRGVVFDASGRPSPGVTVSVQNGTGGYSAVTDRNGAYEIRDIVPGTYNLSVNVGNGAFRHAELESGKTTVVDFRIAPEPRHMAKPYGAPPARRRIV